MQEYNLIRSKPLYTQNELQKRIDKTNDLLNQKKCMKAMNQITYLAKKISEEPLEDIQIIFALDLIDTIIDNHNIIKKYYEYYEDFKTIFEREMIYGFLPIAIQHKKLYHSSFAELLIESVDKYNKLF